MSFRPNRSLLEPNFAGYELAKGEKPILKETKLEEPTNVARLEENQFSYAHVRSFALHNHLFVDPWAKDVAYFVSEARNIFSVAQVRERSVSSPICVTKVAELPEPASKSSAATNGSITFPADGLAVVSDGTGKLIVYETKDTWQCTWSTAYGKCGVVAASRGGSEGKMACALVEIAPSGEKTVQIDWLVLIPDGTKGYGISLVQKVACLSWPILVAFESDCSALYLLSESTDVVREKNKAVPVRDCDADFSDSEIQELERLAKQKIEFVRETDEKEASQSPCQAKRHKNKERDSDNEEEEESKKLYQWSQTDDEVLVAFNLPRDVNRGEIICKVEKTRLTFGLSDGTGLLNSELYGNVSLEGSCWTKEGRRVDVALEKEETGRFWPTLVSVKGVRQENVTDGESAKVDPAESLTANKPLSEMTEVCDLAPDDESFLLKIDPHGKAICKVRALEQRLARVFVFLFAG